QFDELCMQRPITEKLQQDGMCSSSKGFKNLCLGPSFSSIRDIEYESSDCGGDLLLIPSGRRINFDAHSPLYFLQFVPHFRVLYVVAKARLVSPNESRTDSKPNANQHNHSQPKQ